MHKVGKKQTDVSIRRAGRKQEVNLPALKSHIRSHIQEVLRDMAPYLDPKEFDAANLEYLGLLESEHLLKEKYPQLYQDVLLSGIVETQRSPRKTIDDEDRYSKLRDVIIQAAKEPSISRYTSGTALYELNSLRRSERNLMQAQSKINYNPRIIPKRTTLMMFTGSDNKQSERPGGLKPGGGRVGGRTGTVSSTRTSTEDLESVLRTVEYQRSKIDQLTKRLNDAELDEEIDEKAIQLSNSFRDLYRLEWHDAWMTMNKWFKDKESEIIYNLFRIVRFAYEFCRKASKEQLSELTRSTAQPLLQPVKLPYMETYPSTEQRAVLTSTGVKCAKRFRKEVATVSIPQLCLKFKETVIGPDFGWDPEKLPRCLTNYIDKAVEIIWIMCVQDPPLVLDWPSEGSKVNTDKYTFFDREGTTVQLCVWPCVYVSTTGPLLSKGIVIASKK